MPCLQVHCGLVVVSMPVDKIKVAGQTYRQTGIDFWGGPIDTNAVNITPDKCQAYDKHWKVTKQEVLDFINDPNAATNDIKNWPGNGDPTSNEGYFLAPYIDGKQ
jgi:hypothetical protein